MCSSWCRLISEESESGSCMSHARAGLFFWFGEEEGPRGTPMFFRRLFFVPTVGSGPPGTLVLFRNVTVAVFLFFLDGQREREHEHAGTGAGRQEHAATDSAGRLDQEPRAARQNRRTKVSLLRPVTCRFISPPHMRVCVCVCVGCVSVWTPVLCNFFNFFIGLFCFPSPCGPPSQFLYSVAKEVREADRHCHHFVGNMRSHCSCRRRTYCLRTPRWIRR